MVLSRARLLDAWKKLGFDLRDAHCYGGIFLVALGGDLMRPGLLLAGLALFYLALRPTPQKEA